MSLYQEPSVGGICLQGVPPCGWGLINGCAVVEMLHTCCCDQTIVVSNTRINYSHIRLLATLFWILFKVRPNGYRQSQIYELYTSVNNALRKRWFRPFNVFQIFKNMSINVRLIWNASKKTQDCEQHANVTEANFHTTIRENNRIRETWSQNVMYCLGNEQYT